MKQDTKEVVYPIIMAIVVIIGLSLVLWALTPQNNREDEMQQLQKEKIELEIKLLKQQLK